MSKLPITQHICYGLTPLISTTLPLATLYMLETISGMSVANFCLSGGGLRPPDMKLRPLRQSPSIAALKLDSLYYKDLRGHTIMFIYLKVGSIKPLRKESGYNAR